MKAIITLVLFALFLSSCSIQKRCERLYPARDSIVIKDTIIYQDRMVYDTLEADTIRTIIPKGWLYDTLTQEKEIFIRDEKSIARLSLEKGELTLELIQKDTIIERLLKDAEVLRKTSKEHYQTRVIEKKYIPKFYKICLYWSILTWILLIIYVAIRLWKGR